MNAIKSVVRNGQICLNAPANWPEGAEVLIELVSPPTRHGSAETTLITGMTEEEQGDDPASIARWIAEFEAIPRLLMTPEEEAQGGAARKAQRQFELATSDERAEKLRRMWE